MNGTLGMGGISRFRQRLLRLAIWLALPLWVLILFAIGWGLWSPRPPHVQVIPTAIPTQLATVGPQSGAYAGEIAPDFRLPTLDGATTALSDHRGHRVLLNFFTTWCDPCRAEMPGLEAQAQKHAADDWVVLGVDIMESAKALSGFRAEFGLTFPLLLDENADVARQYQVTGTPTSLFIDRAGRVVERQVGYMSESEVASVIASMP